MLAVPPSRVHLVSPAAAPIASSSATTADSSSHISSSHPQSTGAQQQETALKNLLVDTQQELLSLLTPIYRLLKIQKPQPSMVMRLQGGGRFIRGYKFLIHDTMLPAVFNGINEYMAQTNAYFETSMHKNTNLNRELSSIRDLLSSCGESVKSCQQQLEELTRLNPNISAMDTLTKMNQIISEIDNIGRQHLDSVNPATDIAVFSSILTNVVDKLTEISKYFNTIRLQITQFREKERALENILNPILACVSRELDEKTSQISHALKKSKHDQASIKANLEVINQLIPRYYG